MNDDDVSGLSSDTNTLIGVMLRSLLKLIQKIFQKIT